MQISSAEGALRASEIPGTDTHGWKSASIRLRVEPQLWCFVLVLLWILGSKRSICWSTAFVWPCDSLFCMRPLSATGRIAVHEDALWWKFQLATCALCAPLLTQQPQQCQTCLRKNTLSCTYWHISMLIKRRQRSLKTHFQLEQEHMVGPVFTLPGAVVFAIFIMLRKWLSACWVKVQLLKWGQTNPNTSLKWGQQAVTQV